jgi:hypothetical protein
MGTFEQAKFAYMVPTLRESGRVPEDDPNKSVVRIYKIATSEVPAFKKQFDNGMWTWMPIHGMHALETFGGRPMTPLPEWAQNKEK